MRIPLAAVAVALASVLGLTTGVAVAAPASARVPLIPGGGGTPDAGWVPGATRSLVPAATGATGSGPAGYPVLGIDVASYQDDINWSKVAAGGAAFAYVKATEGTTYTNPLYGDQSSGAMSAGLDVGSYAFGRPDANDPVHQADYLVTNSQPMTAGRTLPFMLDLEWPYQGTGVKDKCWGLKPAAMVTWVRSFVDEIRAKTGMPTLIYTNPYWWNPCTGSDTSFTDQLLDIAYWADTPPTVLPAGWSAWTFWQYADSGALPGDQDVFGGSAADLALFTYPAITHPQFPDVPASAPFYADITWLAHSGIATGYAGGGFHPAATVSRQAMAAFLYRSAHDGTDAPRCTRAPGFTDVTQGATFCGAISWLATSGISGGFADGGFHPAAPVSRQAMAAFLYRSAHDGTDAPACTTASGFTDVQPGNQFCGAISWLAATGISGGFADGGFHPASSVSRQAMAHFLHEMTSAPPA